MRHLFYPNAKYRFYPTDNGLVKIVCVNWNDLYKYDETKFIHHPDIPGTILEFDTEAEAKEFQQLRMNIERISPCSKNDYFQGHLIYRPYYGFDGFVTVVEIVNNRFDVYEFERFYKRDDVAGTFIEFDSLEQAIGWICEFVPYPLIHPLIRPLDHNRYLLKPSKGLYKSEK